MVTSSPCFIFLVATNSIMFSSLFQEVSAFGTHEWFTLRQISLLFNIRVHKEPTTKLKNEFSQRVLVIMALGCLLKVEKTPWCSALTSFPKQKLFVRKIPSQLLSQPTSKLCIGGSSSTLIRSLPFFLLQSCRWKNFCLALDGSSWTTASRWRTFDSLPQKCFFECAFMAVLFRNGVWSKQNLDLGGGTNKQLWLWSSLW